MRKPGEIFTGFLFLWGQMLQNLSMGQIAPGYEKQKYPGFTAYKEKCNTMHHTFQCIGAPTHNQINFAA